MKKKYLLPVFFLSALSYGQIGINNLTPKITLDVRSKTTDGSTSEGFMVPRVTGNSLKAAEAAGVYADDQHSALVFVTEAPDPNNRTGQVEGMDASGFYYFDAGSNRWVKMVSSGTNTAAVSQLLCSSATHIGVLEAGEVSAGVETTIPYSGGNGGIYSGMSIPSTGVTGLTAVLLSGTLNNGSGSLIFNITGTPSAAGTAVFDIDFSGFNCGFTRTVQPNGSFPDVVPVIINGQIRQMLTHNLGADTSQDPNVPNQAIMGNYYQWGKKNVAATAYTSAAAISGWNTAATPSKAWNSGTAAAPVKTVNDPCPNGFRVLTQNEFIGFNTASTNSNIGSWTLSDTNFGTAKVFTNNGNIVTFPAAGSRQNANGGALGSRGNVGYYWTSSESTNTTAAYGIRFTVSDINVTYHSDRNAAMSIRCISE
ncbi:uncharacterized protein (TIGR02145 family) [Chryseobacterium sp. PvR013]|uniref:FISUMP domain-containing protein n=1 Tax=Chryseobacterium sp. PvR013 TaxID=2806595 RepID=UPI001AEB8599|nr:FISUMP domain-containing protein [Chryseobacterium sp. PvR013]MBP1164669.1 uncharacterized protein (TIGR02145 family) [Chryseobacterium sp. PvR013]